MKPKTLPRTRMDLRPDPLLDQTRGQRWIARARSMAWNTAWALVAVGSWAAIVAELERRDLATENGDLRRDRERLSIELVDTRQRLAALRTDGTCTSLFYLIEAPDAASIDAQLRRASLAIDNERIRVLASMAVEVPKR